MYCETLLEEFKKKNIQIGDRIKVNAESGIFEGVLMPRPDYGDSSLLVLKMDNGYNAGIKPQSIELVAHSKKRERETKQLSRVKNGISILGCGGTIASCIEYETGAVYPSITPDQLRHSFPELGKWNINSKQIFSLFSEDLNSHHWKILADEIENELKDGSEGIVIMHGTDTMSYTATAISFMLQNLPSPIIFVGSQRSSDRPSSENKMNLLNSVFAATKDLGEVGICMHASTNDDFCHIHRGNRARKMHTSMREAFKSVNSLPLLKVDYSKDLFEPLSDFKKRSKDGLISKKEINPNVALIYVHPNINPNLISKLDSYDGVVLMGTGLGHVATGAFGDKSVKSIYNPIKELISSGIPVVMSPQAIFGRICMRVYTNGRLLMDAGVIGDGMDWSPETAYVKLCWALGQTKDMKKVKEIMETNIANEISTRTVSGF